MDSTPGYPFARYVALGDSQTEGIGDPDGAGGHRGWADRFAALLGAGTPALGYANLAIRGRRAGQIRAEQLEPALALRPDLVTVMAGMNDIIRPRFDRAALLADLHAMFAALTATGARVVTFTYPDIGGVAPFVRPLSPRVREVNAEMRRLAAEYRLTLVDFEPVAATTHPLVWSEDRLHLSPLGHDLVARAVADTLGVPGADATWRDPLPVTRRGAREILATEFTWAANHMLPWVARRIRGQSSGTGIEPKRPELRPLAAS
ncbi:SGNH/GDSL hydrolase family protein [Nocardia puris]|uniref:Lysophospholipase L1-like esterase n=1 Tax=Nocardia puris TaxID=208602 RepID=A0A366DY31_9NOCA|nr:SGNH/GDSL hydrolase family protein [Nocardia puris]MBF6210068.1 SGNH/GDSL hydrolase family protein [Nocardia puris]MBF6368259.1 SGNH/GDSL hydrolase family protein [Nocardia puris]MBF6458022.1 SGNH/GDSL hydrolase family protein [Nocardia puris]RBO94184.1 lysophospholipase L1-like esterase [Nocardia puris]